MMKTRRAWQLYLKAHLTPIQYRLIAVEEAARERFTANVVHPDSRAVIVKVALDPDAPDAGIGALREILMAARPPQRRDVTIIPHYPNS